MQEDVGGKVGSEEGRQKGDESEDKEENVVMEKNNNDNKGGLRKRMVLKMG